MPVKHALLLVNSTITIGKGVAKYGPEAAHAMRGRTNFEIKRKGKKKNNPDDSDEDQIYTGDLNLVIRIIKAKGFKESNTNRLNYGTPNLFFDADFNGKRLKTPIFKKCSNE